MSKLYGRKTSQLFQEYFKWARPIIGKRVSFYPAAAGAPLGTAREMDDHIRIECRTSQPMDRLEAAAAHELMHVVLWREDFAKSEHDGRVRGEQARAAHAIGRELGNCLSDPVVHHRLTDWGFTVVQDILSESVQNLMNRLKDERVAAPEPHTWQGKVCALEHAGAALSLGPERFSPVDQVLSSWGPSIHALMHRLLDVVNGLEYHQPEENWQALTRVFDVIDEPNVRLRRPSGTVYPPLRLG